MDLRRIEKLEFSGLSQSYDRRDTMLYALGLGYGDDPLDRHQLQYVYERALLTVPSMCSILCQPGFWAKEPEFDVDWVKVLHAEQAFEILSPIPADATLVADVKIAGVEDKGADKGALVHQEKHLFTQDGTSVARVRTTLFLRGDGGQGGFGRKEPPAAPLPDNQPDHILSIPTSQRAALIYRLSGDWNPLHADPEVAKAAGFDRPILHGLCTMGVACRALLQQYGDMSLSSLFVRFSRPVYPGETIRVEMYEEAETVRFRAVAAERDVVVLDRCRATFA